MWPVTYYTRPNGRMPAQAWIEDQNNTIKPSIDAKLEMLRQVGLLLKENRILEPIKENPGGKIVPNFYELRDVSKGWRIAVYHDRRKDIFVLISGWRKSRRLQRGDVAKALTLLGEYLSIEGE